MEARRVRRVGTARAYANDSAAQDQLPTGDPPQTGETEHQSLLTTGDDRLREGEAPAQSEGMAEMETDDDHYPLDVTENETVMVTSLPRLRPPKSRPTTKMSFRATEGTEMLVTYRGIRPKTAFTATILHMHQ
jgi:hypothetical protein